MSSFLGSMVFGDLGNWAHTKEVEKQSDTNAFKLKLKETLDKEQSLSIVELELAFASILSKLNEKGILSQEEILSSLETAETGAKNIMKQKNRTINASLRK